MSTSSSWREGEGRGIVCWRGVGTCCCAYRCEPSGRVHQSSTHDIVRCPLMRYSGFAFQGGQRKIYLRRLCKISSAAGSIPTTTALRQPHFLPRPPPLRIRPCIACCILSFIAASPAAPPPAAGATSSLGLNARIAIQRAAAWPSVSHSSVFICSSAHSGDVIGAVGSSPNLQF